MSEGRGGGYLKVLLVDTSVPPTAVPHLGEGGTRRCVPTLSSGLGLRMLVLGEEPLVLLIERNQWRPGGLLGRLPGLSSQEPGGSPQPRTTTIVVPLTLTLTDKLVLQAGSFLGGEEPNRKMGVSTSTGRVGGNLGKVLVDR